MREPDGSPLNVSPENPAWPRGNESAMCRPNHSWDTRPRDDLPTSVTRSRPPGGTRTGFVRWAWDPRFTTHWNDDYRKRTVDVNPATAIRSASYAIALASLLLYADDEPMDHATFRLLKSVISLVAAMLNVEQ